MDPVQTIDANHAQFSEVLVISLPSIRFPSHLINERNESS